MNPSGVIMKPEPFPLSSRVPRLTLMRCLTSMLTTAGATRATALTTLREYASSKAESSRAIVAASAYSFAGFAPAPESVSFKRKSIDRAFSLRRDVIAMEEISDDQTRSQLHTSGVYTHFLERYSPLAPARPLFYIEACKRARLSLLCWTRSVRLGWCSTELLINGPL